MTPPPEVLDLFAVPDDVLPLPGGSGDSVRAGDLVLSPGRDAAVAAWLSPLLARLAVALDEDLGRRERDLRVAVPVPARDGSWVVVGWGATRYEAGTVACHDLEVTLAAGRVLHARLDVAVRARPPGLDERDDRWARAERLVFGPPDALPPAVAGTPAATVVDALLPLLDPTVDLGPDQLVHADLAGNVLLDARGAPVVIDVSPAWRPVRWAEAVCVLDAVHRGDATPDVLGRWTQGADHQALLRAIAWRALTDPPGAAAYDELLGLVASR